MNLQIPEGTTKIEAGAFQDCRSLDQIIIPDTVTEIGDRAFAGCDYLKELIIPASVEKIGRNLCSGCSRLERFEMQGTAQFDISWLNGCLRLENIILSQASGVTVWNGVIYNQDLTELIFVPYSLQHLILPPTVREAVISEKIIELSFYAFQHLEIQTKTLRKLHFYTEQKAFHVIIPDIEPYSSGGFRSITDTDAVRILIHTAVRALQTGIFPRKEDWPQFMEINWNTELTLMDNFLPILELRFNLAEITAELYQQDWKEVCCRQLEELVEDFQYDSYQEQLNDAMTSFFSNHLNYLFCLERFPEWKAEVLTEFIRSKSTGIIKNILEHYDFTEEETDFMLKCANELQKYDSQLILMHYRRERFGYTEPAEKLKL